MTRSAATPVQATRSYIGRNGNRGVEVICPFCEHRHTHGWPLSSDDRPGLRIAHCSRGNYDISPPPEGTR